ncbi:MAG: methyltransferase domain-containing protein [Dehalococcoidia bacterium]|nr:methyltransferase domain-containing protein [Dehalococcoidia bacterium]
MTTPEGALPQLPPEFFRRFDERPDEDFYVPPRLVTHIDDATIEALTGVYRDLLPRGGRILDLMSSWVSHLPPEVPFARVAGLGMNSHELATNERLTDHVVHNLNEHPTLPYEDGAFDAVVNTVSVQYLTRPAEVFRDIRRVLAPGGISVVAISHRMFGEKAIALWQSISMEDRVRLVGAYFALAGGWDEPRVIDRSPEDADPLLVIYARRLEA